MRPLLLALVTFLIGLGAASGQEKKLLAVEDLYLAESYGPTLKVPGENKEYAQRTWIDAKTKQERHALRLRAGTTVGPAEKGAFDARQPTLSPDGKWLAFVSTRARPAGWKQTPSVFADSDPAVDIWLLPTKGGDAIPLAGPDKPYGRVFHDGFYGHLAFSPDGKRLVFVADDGSDPRTKEEIANHVVIDRPDQGEGYMGYGPAQIWVAVLDPAPEKSAAKKILRLTKDDVWYGDPHWSPNNEDIAVHANKTKDRESVRYSLNKNFDIYVINGPTQKQTQVTKGPGPEVSPRFSPDGTKIACLSGPRKGAHRELLNLHIISKGDKGASEKTFADHHSEGIDKTPHPAPMFPLPENCWHNDAAIVYNAESGVHTVKVAVDLTFGKAQIIPGTTKIALPIGLENRVLGETRVFTWKNDNWLLESVLTVPPASVAKAPYKIVVYPHGGPHGRAALKFDLTNQILAAQGYLVFQPNFRGSSGMSQKFIDADRFDLGGGDMRDILTGIDALVKEGLADKNQQYLYGTSYGGFMTTWLVGQTTQFKAGVAINPVTDHTMMWSLSDIPSWTEWELGGKPWEQPERYRKMSPLTYVEKVSTPTLILHSENDRRCPLPMGKAYYRALAARGVPTQLVIYPGEGHGIRGPLHREDVLRRTLAWFAAHSK